jgi:predicted nucleotide-binding protein
MDDDERALLLDLVAYVEKSGAFPSRQSFLIGQRSRIAAFDRAEATQLLRKWRAFIVWTIAALTQLGGTTPFAAAELERARHALAKLQELFVQKPGADHSLVELANWFGWGDTNQVRRALILLQPLPIFDHFSIWLEGADEKIVMSEQVLRLEGAAIFAVPEPAPPIAESSQSFPSSEQELARAAYEYFVNGFAKVYRDEGRVVLIGPPRSGTAEEQKRSILVHEYLARRGLTEPTNSPRIFRISSRGKDLAFRDHEVKQLLGLTPAQATAAPTPSKGSRVARKVFIVHGQNHSVRDRIELFLVKDLRLETVVMQEEANGGRTLPEKFEDVAADCAFAVFIVTADDRFSDADGKAIVRARQNVILEVGYFWGKLGRKHKIAVLVEDAPGLELPSDLQGIGWIPITADLAHTKERLRKELGAAGLV